MQVLPYPKQSQSKKWQMAEMFDAISQRYDFLNRLLSARSDVRWRKKSLKKLLAHRPEHILDAATGTADLAIQAAKMMPKLQVKGIDISKGMLAIGQKKVLKAGLQQRIELLQADAESLPFPNAHFDAAMIAFGVRNFENTVAGLSELHRVLRPEGWLLVLEFSKPRAPIIGPIIRAYSEKILPYIGKWLSGEHAAYRYLPRSIAQFPDGADFIQLLQAASYKNTSCKRLSLGIASIYMAQK